MIALLMFIGLFVLCCIISIGVPLIISFISCGLSNRYDDGDIVMPFFVCNLIISIFVSVFIICFIFNPEKYGYQKIQTEQTIEVNENGKD